MTPAALSSEMSKAPFERVTCSPYWSQKEKLEGCVNLTLVVREVKVPSLRAGYGARREKKSEAS